MTDQPSDTINESLAKSIAGRRVLLVADQVETGDAAQAAFESAGLTVQRLRAYEPLRLESENGKPVLPMGEIVVIDGANMDALVAARVSGTLHTVVAILATASGSRDRTIPDLAMTMGPDETTLDTFGVLNQLMDRIVESDIAADPRLPDLSALMAPTDLAALALTGWLALDEAGPITQAHLDALSDGFGRPRPAGLGKSSTMSDATLDSLFSDEVLARERAMRSVYALRDEPRFSMEIGPAFLEDKGFNHRDENDAWNRRQGRGKKGDRRVSRGAPGRR